MDLAFRDMVHGCREPVSAHGNRRYHAGCDLSYNGPSWVRHAWESSVKTSMDGPTEKMSLLLTDYCEVRLEHKGIVLKLDLHSLFSRDRHYLARAKKILILALQLWLVTAVELQVWGYVRNYMSHAYKCVPLHLYVEHFAPLIQANPFHIHVR